MITSTCSEMPTRLKSDTERIVVSPNKLSVKYPENNVHYYGGEESVQANKPVPVNPKTGYYYFEMRVKNARYSNALASIGFTTEDFDSYDMSPFLPG
ncbi:Ran-binding protein M homolog [Linum perenne]